MGVITEQEKVRRESLKAEAEKKVYSLYTFLNNEGGKNFIQELKNQFDTPVLAQSTAHETVIRAAQRDVIRWIEDIVERGKQL